LPVRERPAGRPAPHAFETDAALALLDPMERLIPSAAARARAAALAQGRAGGFGGPRGAEEEGTKRAAVAPHSGQRGSENTERAAAVPHSGQRWSPRRAQRRGGGEAACSGRGGTGIHGNTEMEVRDLRRCVLIGSVSEIRGARRQLTAACAEEARWRQPQTPTGLPNRWPRAPLLGLFSPRTKWTSMGTKAF
jgi:hypothetical protein